MIKVWMFFYKKDIKYITHPAEPSISNEYIEDFVDDRKLLDKYPLWAYTTVKKYAKEFESQRSKDAFIKIKTYIDDDNWNSFIKDYPDQYLERTALVTRKIDNDGVVRLTNMDFVLTRFESLSITDNDLVLMEDPSYWEGTLPDKCFNDKIRKALKVLGYSGLRTIMYDSVKNSNILDDYDLPDITNDEVSVLVYNFQDTFI